MSTTAAAPPGVLALDEYAGPGAYLICAAEPYPNGWHPRHYLGSALNIAARVASHRQARPGRARVAVLIAQFNGAGIGWRVVRVWPTADCRTAEITLKRRHDLAPCCPACNPDGWARNGVLPGRAELWPH